jgi:hypothetical protein
MHDEVTQHKQYVLKLELVEEVNVFKNEAHHGGARCETKEVHVTMSSIIVPSRDFERVISAMKNNSYGFTSSSY